VVSGMIGVTFFGIFLTPVFYYVISWLSDKKKPASPTPPAPAVEHAPAPQPIPHA
jgi:multidrug efflux pump